MKLYEPRPDDVLRISIHKQGEKVEYLTVCEVTQVEAYNQLRSLIEGENISVFEGGRVTTIRLREAIGGKNGKTVSLSFKGITPKKTLDLILNYLKSKNMSSNRK